MAGLGQCRPQLGPAQPALEDAQQQRPHRADAARLGGGEHAAVDAAQHDDDQGHDGRGLEDQLDQAHLGFDPPGERLGLGDVIREAPRHEPDQPAIGDRQHDAGDDAGDEQIADRGLRQDAIEDQQQARRDQHAEHRGSGDHADGEARLVAQPQHLGHRDLGEHRGRGDRGAGDRGEHRVGADRGHAQPRLDAAEGVVGDVVGVLADVGDADQQAHQDE